MNKLFKKIVASTLALTLLVPGVVGAQNTATPATTNLDLNETAGVGAVTTLEIKKTLDTVEGTDAYFNGNKYVYNIQGKSAAEGTDKDRAGIQKKDAIEGLLKFTDNDNTIELEAGSNAKTENTVTFFVDKNLLTNNVQPGVYEYTLSEESTAIDGETNNQLAETTVRVYVSRENGELVASLIAIPKGSETKNNLETTTSFKTDTLTVKTVVEGNAANLEDGFKFIITIVPKEDNVENEADKYTLSGDAEVSNLDQENNTVTATLKNGQTISVNGLSAGDTYTVKEVATGTVSKQEYVTDEVNKSGITGNGAGIDADVDHTVTNTLNATIPTGILENIAPFVIMIAVAGGFAFFYFRRRDREEA